MVTLAALVALGAGTLLWWRCEGDLPTVAAPESVVLGRKPQGVTITLADPGSGLRDVDVRLVQGEAEPVVLVERLFPGEILGGGVPPREPVTLELELDARKHGLEEGEAVLRVAASDWSWASFLSGNQGVTEIPVAVDLSPPRVLVETGLSYVSRGGAGAVVYSIDEGAVRDGVSVGDSFYPGFPFPGTALGEARQARGGRRLALYAVARDAPPEPAFRVVAEDAAANVTEATWPVRYRERTFEEARIALSDGFLEGKVAALARELEVEGDPLSAFRVINEKVRGENEARIREIVAGSGPERHWRGVFRQMRSSAVTSRFAEHRTYLRGPEPVSQAVHYGYDLASTSAAPITASNAGRVLFADRLGIYGSCVILDHGLGLTSLYAHLSSISVAAGDPVDQGDELGRSGATGLAGGDHLHFAILVGGTYVDPKEWWDPKWVREKVEGQLE
jgi:murein DD-endopeptidase MepM/ murein hydrolase activator NlpD